MRTKYSLRPVHFSCKPVVSGNTKTGHTFFLPLMMIAVVGMTFLLVATTEPRSHTETTKNSNFEIRISNLSGELPEKKAVKDLGVTLSEKSVSPSKAPETPLQAPMPVLVSPTEKSATFVSTKKLAIAEPLLDTKPELVRAADPDPVLNSITYSDPEKENGYYGNAKIPAPNAHVAMAPEQPQTMPTPTGSRSRPISRNRQNASTFAPSATASTATCPPPRQNDANVEENFAKLAHHPIQITLSGKTQCTTLGQLFDTPAKLGQIRQFLSEELTSGSTINASMVAKPELNIGLSVDRPEIPTARVISSVPSQCAMPLIKSCAPESNFTEWMTPYELNEYILSKQNSCGKSFWDQGHWIAAIEGRLLNNIQEFRIVCDKTPGKRNFLWRYRIAQSREDFNEKLALLQKDGFRLIQSQMFVDNDQMPKFQAVWLRM